MGGAQSFQGAMYSYVSLEERVPARHPLRKLRALVDALLASMSPEFDAVYSRNGRPSVSPEMLLKALLLQIRFIRRQDDDSQPLAGRNPELDFKGQPRSNATHAKLAGQTLMCFAAYYLVSMGSMGGCRSAQYFNLSITY